MRLATTEPTRHENPTIKAIALAYVILDRPDLKKAEEYLSDFGLRTVSNDGQTLFMRGAESSPYCYVARKAAKPRFVGMGFAVDSVDDLQKLAKLPGASSVETSPWPGGGKVVHLTDPSGFRVDAVFGRADVAALPHRPPMAMNSIDSRSRVNDTQRPPMTPPDVIRLGHVALELADYQATAGWYTQHLGFIPSDVEVLPDGSPAVAFLRLNRGDQPSDHHTLALVQTFAPVLNHISFELIDADAVGIGNRLMRDRGWIPAWGIGRHMLGSQIFDYWRDPWGDRHEHYCDGDIFTEVKATGVYPASRASMAQWGQPLPPSFVRPKISFETIGKLIHALRHSPDVTLSKLITIMKTFA